MTREELIDAVVEEIERIFGAEGFGGETIEYEWLIKNYGVTEEEDVTWQFIIDDNAIEELAPEDEDDAQVIAFLRDEKAVIAFLEKILGKYRSNTVTIPETSEGRA